MIKQFKSSVTWNKRAKQSFTNRRAGKKLVELKEVDFHNSFIICINNVAQKTQMSTTTKNDYIRKANLMLTHI